jgi:hypothetical protein
MNFRRLSVMLAVAAAVGWGAAEARADGCCGWGGAPFYPFYSLYGREHIPYFALHPPVYYSYPVPRSYGYSPFAYPFGSPTPEIELAPPKVEKKAEPKTMLNPFVRETSTSEPSQAGRAPQVEPKVVYNPFFTAPVAAARN